MGIAWCRERVEEAHNSKSPVDRILVRCSKVIHPGTYDKPTDDFVYRGMRVGNTAPVPVHAPPPRARRANPAKRVDSGWQTCTLQAPDSDNDRPEAPIPPPRKRRKRRINSLEILNTQLQLLRQPGFVQSDLALSENLLKYEYITQRSEDTTPPRPSSTPSLTEISPGNADLPKTRSNLGLFIKATQKNGKSEKPPKEENSSVMRGANKDDVKVVLEDGRIKNDNTKKSEQQKIKVKNFSTVSLPNYNELVKPNGEVSPRTESKVPKASRDGVRPKSFVRIASAPSLPGEGTGSILSTLSEVTMNRLETYMKRCRSFGALKPQQILEKLEEFDRNARSASESSDSWAGLDDWDLGVIEYWNPDTPGVPPLEPKSKLTSRVRKAPVFSVGPPRKDKSDFDSVPLTPNVETPEPSIDIPPEELEKDASSHVADEVLEPKPEQIPNEWFEEINTDENQTSTPQTADAPDQTMDDLGVAEQNNEDDDPHSALLKIIKKYAHIAGADGAPTPFTSSVFEDEEEEVQPVAPRRKSKDEIKFRHRKRSSSLKPDGSLEVPARHRKGRSMSISFDSVVKLPEIDEIRSRYTAEDAAKGLNRKLLPWDLPEDVFDMHIEKSMFMKKRPSLRQSLSEFLGFEQEEALRPTESGDLSERTSVSSDGDGARKTPPPLPLSPPPPLSLSKSPSFDSVLTSPSLVKHTCSDQNRN